MLKNIPFYLIFPLFIIYNIGLLFELFSPIQIGYYSLVYPIVAILLFKFPNNNSFKFFKTDFLFSVYIFFSIFVYAINSPFMNSEKVLYYLQIIVIQIVIYLSIRQFNFSRIDIKIFKILFWIITVSLVLKLKDSLFIYFDASKGMSTYQGLSRCLVLTSLIIIYSLKNRIKFLYFLVTVFILFILGSRSEFALFLIGIFVVFILNKKRTLTKLVSIVISIILLISLYNPKTVNSFSYTSRIFSLLNPQKALNEGGRSKLSSNAYNTISENILFGDINNVDIGESAHNILSAWEINGVLFFLLILGISFMNFYLRLKDFRNLKRNFHAKIAFFYSILWFVGMFTSYWYGNEMFAVALGISANLEVFKSRPHE